MESGRSHMDHKPGTFLEGFTGFLGRYAAIRIIFGYFVKVALNIIVLYVLWHLVCKTG